MSVTGFNRRRRELEAKKPAPEVKMLASDEKSLSQLTVPALKEKAAELGIEGFDNMKKAELVDALLKALEPKQDAE